MSKSFLTKWENVIKRMPLSLRTPEPLVLTTHTEIIFGGIRLSPGTYLIQKIENPEHDDPPF